MSLRSWPTIAALVFASSAGAQATARDSVKAPTDTAKWGSFDPGNGFTVAKTDRGTLAISAYLLWRYINQLPVNATYIDHLGVERNIHTRNDLQLHRLQVFLKGWVYLPKLTYAVTIWTVNATSQVAVVGIIAYHFSETLTLSGGVNGLPGTRSLMGSHPYWLASDRVMADEFFRPGFTSGIWLTQEVLPRLHYTAMVGNNLSQLGITSSQLTRYLATGASVWWMPTTGEFGPRGAYGDYEWHDTLATRFGTSYTHSRENRFNQISIPSPDNTQIRTSDALLLFETGTLAPGVTLTDATFQLNSFDVGLKYHGLFLQSEYYYRRLNRFKTDLPVSLAHLVDQGWMLQFASMVMPRKLELYASTSQIYGSFNRAADVLGGVNWYPGKTRNFRSNLQLIRTWRSPVASVFGYYAGGLTGWIVSAGTSVLF